MNKPSQATPAWEIRKSDHETVATLARELKISTTVARVLVNRKITTVAAAERFLQLDHTHIHAPHLLKDMDKAVERVLQAIERREKIYIYGDYDVDGAVATSLLMLFFQDVHYPVEYYIPNRMFEGYSLNCAALDTLKSRGVNLIITVDNGIMANKEVDYATKVGIDIIITDHHQVGPALPAAFAVVNPQRKDCSYPFKGICGAGVAFKLMLAVRQALREKKHFQDFAEPNLKQYLDLLCIPTVCDVVPLVDENRFFVKEGLRHLAHTKRPGLIALAKVCGLEDKELSSYDLGFKFGPRINACGRLEDASLGVRLLISNSIAEATPLAARLNRLNQERREIEQSITEEALAKVAREIDLNATLGVVVYEPSWHIGVVGIVASRLTEKLNRPVFVLGDSESGAVKGSGRSVPSVSLVAALRECHDLLQIYGGHEAAAGLTLAPENVDAFCTAFDVAIKKQMRREELTRKTWVDDELYLTDINKNLVRELGCLEPFGMGNAKPLFAAADLKITTKRIVGEHHLKLKVARDAQVFDAIAFNKSNVFESLTDTTGLVFGVEINLYNNQETIQLIVKDFF